MRFFAFFAALVASGAACLGGSGGACCPSSQPSCGNPCGGGLAPAVSGPTAYAVAPSSYAAAPQAYVAPPQYASPAGAYPTGK